MRRLDTVYRDIRIARPTLTFPTVNPNSAIFFDLAVTGLEVGSHLITWAPVEDSRTFDDLVLQWLCISPDLLRVAMINATCMMISPGIIDCIFVFGVMTDGVIATLTIDDFP